MRLRKSFAKYRFSRFCTKFLLLKYNFHDNFFSHSRNRYKRSFVFRNLHICLCRLLCSMFFVSSFNLMMMWTTLKKFFENKIELANLRMFAKIFDCRAKCSVYFWYRIDKNFRIDMKNLAEKRKRKRKSEIDFC